MSNEVNNTGMLKTAGVVINKDAKIFYQKKREFKKSPYITKDFYKNCKIVDGIPNADRGIPVTNTSTYGIGISEYQGRILTRKYSKAFLNKKVAKQFSLKNHPTRTKIEIPSLTNPFDGTLPPKKVESNESTVIDQSTTTYDSAQIQSESIASTYTNVATSTKVDKPIKPKINVEYETLFKITKIVGILSIVFSALCALFVQIRATATCGVPSSYAWLRVFSIILLVFSFVCALGMTGVFTYIAVRRTIPMFKNKSFKTYAPINSINAIAIILLIVFAILSIAKIGSLTNNSTDFVGSYKLQAFVGIVTGLSFYVTQYAICSLNADYCDAQPHIKINRSFLMSIAFATFLSFLFTFLFIIFYNTGIYMQAGSIYVAKYVAGVIGVTSIMMMIYAGLSVYNHFLVNKNPNFIRDTIIYGCIALLNFILFIIVAAKLASNSSSPFNAALFIVTDIFEFATGVVALIFAKKMNQATAE